MTALTDAFAAAQAELANVQTALGDVQTYIANNGAEAALAAAQADNAAGVENFGTLTTSLTGIAATLNGLAQKPAA